MNKDKLYFDKDADLNIIKTKKVGIIGYGNQGKAQALNLIDSGVDVTIGIRKSSKTINLLKASNIKYDDISNITKHCDVISLLIPDKTIPDVFNKYVFPYLREGQTILFSHGYNIHYKTIIVPDYVNVVMVAPGGGGKVVRDSFKDGGGVPTLIAIHRDFTGDSLNLIKSYSKGIGGTRICAFLSTFKEETETDLFGEQVVLTGGLPYYINKSIKVLIDSGYSPTVAWFVCYYELKTIVDLFHKNGFNFLYNAISDTARYGGLTRGNYLIDESLEIKMKKILNDIQDGSFHKEMSKSEKKKYISPFSKKDQETFNDLFETLFKDK